ncbi:hypothetical protein FWH13_00690 [Candidatus Saccharibacteria bacterium]|nr:hypothetical protein [Candidatus Saccharibacteria bacterium]
MSESGEPVAEKNTGSRNLWMLFGLAVLATGVVVAGGLALYYGSGTYLLDLSRPRGEWLEVLPEEDWSFRAEGDLNQRDLYEFIEQFSGMRGRINDSRVFAGDELTDEGLGLR